MRSPNPGETLSELLIKAQNVETRWLTKRLLPLELEEIGRRALARDPEARYPSAGALGKALSDWLAGQGA
ncbi:MAG: hypothetical protein JKY65_27090 [Planctomycetes bacterium]|nr:hypothetical protein [Planctomycetota bacterium]